MTNLILEVYNSVGTSVIISEPYPDTVDELSAKIGDLIEDHIEQFLGTIDWGGTSNSIELTFVDLGDEWDSDPALNVQFILDKVSECIKAYVAIPRL